MRRPEATPREPAHRFGMPHSRMSCGPADPASRCPTNPAKALCIRSERRWPVPFAAGVAGSEAESSDGSHDPALGSLVLPSPAPGHQGPIRGNAPVQPWLRGSWTAKQPQNIRQERREAQALARLSLRMTRPKRGHHCRWILPAASRTQQGERHGWLGHHR
jgi:hypothetical protein